MRNKKQVLAAVCALCMLIGSIVPMTFYADIERGITKQPTSDNPSVEVNDETGASYQWYHLKRDEVPVVDGSAPVGEGQIGANVGAGTFSDGVFHSDEVEKGRIYVDFYANAGEVIKIVPSENYCGAVFVSSNNYGVEVAPDNQGIYYREIRDSGNYAISLQDSEDFSVEIFLLGEVSEELMEGQNTNVLTEAEAGEQYVCKVTYPDAQELISQAVTINYEILTQPTIENPTVTLSYTKGASYQWYQQKLIYDVVDKDMQAGELERNASVVQEGTYDRTQGVWYGEYLSMEFELRAGEMLIVTPSEGFEGDVHLCHGETRRMPLTDGVYTYMPQKTVRCKLEVSNLAGTTVKVQIKGAEALNGENAPSLKTAVCDVTYVCVINWKNRCAAVTEPLTFQPIITSQPTKDTVSVGVNFPEQVSSYQWYEVEKHIFKGEKYTGLHENGVYYADGFTGTYDDHGIWRSEEGWINLYLDVEAGDVIELAPAKEEDAGKFGHGCGEISEEKNGGYILTPQVDNKCFYLPIWSEGEQEEDYSVRIRIRKADGKVYDVAKYDAEANNGIASYNYFGDYEDGNWISVDEDGMHYVCIQLMLKKDDIVQLYPAQSFTGDVYLRQEFELEELKVENGVVTYVVPEDRNVELVMEAQSLFSVRYEVIRYGLKDALSGQNQATLTTEKEGIYACVVTLKNGTKLISDPVTVEEKEALPPSGEPSIPNEGDHAMGYLWWMTGITMLGIALALRKRIRF